jgi:hypothetical protein
MQGTMTLVEGIFAVPTPAGVFYAIGGREEEPGRKLLMNLVTWGASEPLTRQNLTRLAETHDTDLALSLLYRLQRLSFVHGTMHPAELPPDGPLEDVLPTLLNRFSLTGKALLIGEAGFQIACAGYRHEAAEELAAMAVDLAKVYRRHEKLLKGNLKQASEALAVVAPDGRSTIGFWPLYVGSQAFYMCVEGPPQLNQKALFSLVQLLATRYRA